MTTRGKEFQEMKNWLGKAVGKTGMLPVFLTLLALARSARHLRRLHDEVLPENCRLLREDYLKLLDPMRGLMYRAEMKSENGSDPDDDAVRVVLDEVRGEHTLATYYLAQLDQDREWVQLDLSWYIDSMIFSCKERRGQGASHFTTTLFGMPLQIGCYITRCRQYIIVRLNIWEKVLTEPFTHALLKLDKSVKFQIGHRSRSGDLGREMDACFTIPAVGLIEMFTLEGVRVLDQVFVAQPGFIPEALRRLQAMGVPIEKIEPIMVAERRD